VLDCNRDAQHLKYGACLQDTYVYLSYHLGGDLHCFYLLIHWIILDIGFQYIVLYSCGYNYLDCLYAILHCQ
jgi:hypothetical protein